MPVVGFLSSTSSAPHARFVAASHGETRGRKGKYATVCERNHIIFRPRSSAPTFPELCGERLGNRPVCARLTHGTGAKPATMGGGGYAALSWANISDICRV